MPRPNTDNERKQFYSISEVAKIIGVNETALRFWEKEFKEINPRRSSRGVRFYSNEDLETIKLIHYLTKEKGLTLEGVRKRLRDNKAKENSTLEVLQRLKEIRSELLSIRNNIELIETKEAKARLKKGKEEKKEDPADTGNEDGGDDGTFTELSLF